MNRLWIIQLSAATVPSGVGRTIGTRPGCYLLEGERGEYVLIDSGMAADGLRRTFLER